MDDIFGKQAGLFSGVEAMARRIFGVYGFNEIRTPHIEEKKLFTHALGDTTDVVQKEMYEFVDRSEESVALRPEGTAGVVRAYLENNFDKTEGHSRFFYIGPMFRRERPQKGRLRQFHQIGVEQLGTYSAFADAETLHCLAMFLDAAGVKDYKVKINNLGSFEERNAYKAVLQSYFTPLKAKLCPDCNARLTRNVFRVLDCKIPACKALCAAAPPLSDHLSEESKTHFDRVKKSLDLMRINYTEDRYMVRGLDYYTKTVFEFTHESLGAQDALAAGGRYDHLVESLGGPATGAVGFAIGVERLILCLSGPASSEPGRPALIVTLGDEAFKKGFEALSVLRRSLIPAMMDFEGKSLKSQMRYADRERSPFVLIIGDNEIQKNTVVLKDMNKGLQEELSFDAALRKLQTAYGSV